MLSIHLMSWLELTAHELVLSDRFACLGSSLVVVVQVPGEKMGGSIHLSMIISASQAMQTAKAGRYKEYPDMPRTILQQPRDYVRRLA
ncbi:hypothetical protein V6N13_079005 [Hibiscus sabdariffa]